MMFMYKLANHINRPGTPHPPTYTNSFKFKTQNKMWKFRPISITDATNTCILMVTLVIMIIMNITSAVHTIFHAINYSLGEDLNKLSTITMAPIVLNLKDQYVYMLVLWCITMNNAQVLCFSMMYTRCSYVLSQNDLTMLCYVNEELRMFCHIIMNVLYEPLNENCLREKQLLKCFDKFWHFPRTKRDKENASFFVNFFIKQCNMLLTRCNQKFSSFSTFLTVLPFIQKSAFRAHKTTWQCLPFNVNRTISRSRLVLNIKSFKCVSPDFRYKQNDAKNIKMPGNDCSFSSKYYNILKRNDRIGLRDIYTISGKISMTINTEKTLKMDISVHKQNCNHVKAFIMIIKYIYPNG